MAKAHGPLFSHMARGSVGGVFTAANRRGSNLINFAKPTRQRALAVQGALGVFSFGVSFFGYAGDISLVTRSSLQSYRRYIYSMGCESWRALTTLQKDAYSTLARPVNVTGFNLYMKQFLTSHDL